MNDPLWLLVTLSAMLLAAFCVWTGYRLGKPKRDALGRFVRSR